MSLIQELEARGLIQDVMPGTEAQLAKEITTGYVGFDPTADSLHVGNLLPITLLMRLQRAGHRPVALVGGATGMIGDPSGKSAERNLLDEETLRHNCQCIEKQLRRFLNFGDGPTSAILLNNYDWFKEFSFLQFIRTVGKHITVNYMMSKDSVQKRLETGLSFTEFTYQLIQGYDFYYLNKNHGVKLQMGGADQWGNIVTGTELIRRMNHAENPAEAAAEEGSGAFGLTCPLITKSDGGKFGKTESGTIWLDAARTSPYQFYQFWLRLPDVDAARMSYIFSFRPVGEIEALIREHETAPHLRLLQKALAEEMTILVHSEEELRFAQQASQILFGNTAVETLRSLNEKQLLEVMEGVPLVRAGRELLDANTDLVSFLADQKILPSKGEARKMITAGGISLNKEKVQGADFTLHSGLLLNDRYMLIQKGKSNYTLAVFG